MSGSEPAPPAPTKASRGALVVVAIVVVILLVVAALYFGKVGPFSSKPTNSSTSTLPSTGGFNNGAVVTLNFSGSTSCTPGLSTFYPSATAASGATSCEVGSANQNAVPDQIPQWILVPAFAGLSVFGMHSLGATPHGFGVWTGLTVYTDCAAAGSPAACGWMPTELYSPTFLTVEQDANLSSGVGGEPAGVLPSPAYDTLLNTSSSLPSVQWGSIFVFVFDPNIFPDRTNAGCSTVITSTLASPTGNCLTSFTALQRALATNSSDVLTANGNNPLWRASGSSELQAVLVGGGAAGTDQLLNANVYVPYSVAPGVPASFPN